MSGLIQADLYRTLRSKWLWLCAVSMVLVAAALVTMQRTGMDYTVSIDRVIFLPISFYGLAVAALISLLIGEDFSDGFIRNKLITGRVRIAVYLSNMIAGYVSCLVIYSLMISATLIMGIGLFEINVTVRQVADFCVLGMMTCLAYGSIFGMLTMVIADRTTAVVVCMALAFCMLFACLHTNQMMVQKPMKNGLPNPHYMTGIRRAVYEYLHDINPSGQAAQLSAMTCYNPLRWVFIDVLWIAAANGLGMFLFQRKQIR